MAADEPGRGAGPAMRSMCRERTAAGTRARETTMTSQRGRRPWCPAAAPAGACELPVEAPGSADRPAAVMIPRSTRRRQPPTGCCPGPAPAQLRSEREAAGSDRGRAGLTGAALEGLAAGAAVGLASSGRRLRDGRFGEGAAADGDSSSRARRRLGPTPIARSAP